MSKEEFYKLIISETKAINDRIDEIKKEILELLPAKSKKEELKIEKLNSDIDKLKLRLHVAKDLLLYPIMARIEKMTDKEAEIYKENKIKEIDDKIRAIKEDKSEEKSKGIQKNIDDIKNDEEIFGETKRQKLVKLQEELNESNKKVASNQAEIKKLEEERKKIEAQSPEDIRNEIIKEVLGNLKIYRPKDNEISLLKRLLYAVSNDPKKASEMLENIEWYRHYSETKKLGGVRPEINLSYYSKLPQGLREKLEEMRLVSEDGVVTIFKEEPKAKEINDAIEKYDTIIGIIEEYQKEFDKKTESGLSEDKYSEIDIEKISESEKIIDRKNLSLYKSIPSEMISNSLIESLEEAYDKLKDLDKPLKRIFNKGEIDFLKQQILKLQKELCQKIINEKEENEKRKQNAADKNSSEVKGIESVKKQLLEEYKKVKSEKEEIEEHLNNLFEEIKEIAGPEFKDADRKHFYLSVGGKFNIESEKSDAIISGYRRELEKGVDKQAEKQVKENNTEESTISVEELKKIKQQLLEEQERENRRSNIR